MAESLGRAELELDVDAGPLERGMTRSERTVRSRLGQMGSTLAKWGKRAAIGLAVVGTALLGLGVTAAKAGIEMNAELETTQLQFETLMGSAERAEEHVASLFDFAKRTPFETGPIIEASRMMRTFGGDALDTKDNLLLIGDAAAATGAPINELGFWVGRLFSQLQAGKPFGEAAMRLQELAVLSPEARAEMEALQESGADMSEIWGVLQEDLGRFNGAMEKQAQTMEGLTSTLSDQAKIAAADVFQPLFGLMKDFLGSLVDLAESPAWGNLVEGARQSVGTVVGLLQPAVDAFGDWVAQLDEGDLKLDEFNKKFAEFAEGWRDLDWDTAVGRMLDGLGDAIGRAPTDKVASVLTQFMTQAIVSVAEHTPEMVAQLVPVFAKALPKIAIGFGQGLLEAFRDNPITVGAFTAALGALPQTISHGLANLIGRIPLAGVLGKPIIRALAGVGQVLVAAIPATIAGVSTALIAGVAALGTALGVAFHNLIETFAPGVNRALESFGAMIFDFFTITVPNFFTETVPNALGAAFEVVYAFFHNAGARIVDFFSTIPGRIMAALAGLPGLLAGLGGDALRSLLGAVVSGAAAVFGFFAALPGRALGAASGLPGLLADLGSRALGAMAGAIEAAAGAVWSFFSSLPGRVVSAVGDLSGVLVAAGKAVIQGLINGILSMLGPLGDALGRVSSFVAENKGPRERDLRLLYPAGGWIMEGLGRGIIDALPEKLLPALQQAEAELIRLLRSGVVPTVEASVAARAQAGERAGGSAEQVTRQAVGAVQRAIGQIGPFHVRTDANPHEIADEVAWRVRIGGR